MFSERSTPPPRSSPSRGRRKGLSHVLKAALSPAVTPHVRFNPRRRSFARRPTTNPSTKPGQPQCLSDRRVEFATNPYPAVRQRASFAQVGSINQQNLPDQQLRVSQARLGTQHF